MTGAEKSTLRQVVAFATSSGVCTFTGGDGIDAATHGDFASVKLVKQAHL